MTDQVIIEFISSLPLHGILLIAVVVLYRDNQKLRQQVEDVRRTSAGNTALLLDQNTALNMITTHIAGSTPPRGIAPIEPYTAMPPYKKLK